MKYDHINIIQVIIIITVLTVLITIALNVHKDEVTKLCSNENPKWELTNSTIEIHYIDISYASNETRYNSALNFGPRIKTCLAPDLSGPTKRYQCASTCDGDYYFDQGLFSSTCVCGGKQ